MPRARKTKTKKVDATVSTTVSAEERRTERRRTAGEDRRAFWRPTPDRRREATEAGRRESDQA